MQNPCVVKVVGGKDAKSKSTASKSQSSNQVMKFRFSQETDDDKKGLALFFISDIPMPVKAG